MPGVGICRIPGTDIPTGSNNEIVRVTFLTIVVWPLCKGETKSVCRFLSAYTFERLVDDSVSAVAVCIVMFQFVTLTAGRRIFEQQCAEYGIGGSSSYP